MRRRLMVIHADPRLLLYYAPFLVNPYIILAELSHIITGMVYTDTSTYSYDTAIDEL